MKKALHRSPPHPDNPLVPHLDRAPIAAFQAMWAQQEAEFPLLAEQLLTSWAYDKAGYEDHTRRLDEHIQRLTEEKHAHHAATVPAVEFDRVERSRRVLADEVRSNRQLLDALLTYEEDVHTKIKHQLYELGFDKDEPISGADAVSWINEWLLPLVCNSKEEPEPEKKETE